MSIKNEDININCTVQGISFPLENIKMEMQIYPTGKLGEKLTKEVIGFQFDQEGLELNTKDGYIIKLDRVILQQIEMTTNDNIDREIKNSNINKKG